MVNFLNFTHYSKNSEETICFGENIGKRCKGGEVFALMGELGTGKTQLAKGIGKGIGICEDEITSPTFVISQLHTKGRIPFIHIDLYRLDIIEELEDLGWYDFLDMGGCIVVEWAEKINRMLPEDDTIFISLEHVKEEERIINIKFSEKYSYLFLEK